MSYVLNYPVRATGLTASQAPMDPRLKAAYLGIAGIASIAGYVTYKKTDSIGWATVAAGLGLGLPVAAILVGGAMLGGAR